MVATQFSEQYHISAPATFRDAEIQLFIKGQKTDI